MPKVALSTEKYTPIEMCENCLFRTANWEWKRSMNNFVTAGTQNCENAALFFGDGEDWK
jgi:hypothetical protein